MLKIITASMSPTINYDNGPAITGDVPWMKNPEYLARFKGDASVYKAVVALDVGPHPEVIGIFSDAIRPFSGTPEACLG